MTNVSSLCAQQYGADTISDNSIKTENHVVASKPEPCHHVSAGLQEKFTQEAEDDSDYSHYLYRITDRRNGDFYVGVRSCRCSPQKDVYMGSGHWAKNARSDGAPLKKEVLATFDNREDAEEAEALLINMVVSDTRCRNSWKTASTDIRLQIRRGRAYRW